MRVPPLLRLLEVFAEDLSQMAGAQEVLLLVARALGRCSAVTAGWVRFDETTHCDEGWVLARSG